MIENPILCTVSWDELEYLKNNDLNYVYVDVLAREQVLQQKVEPDRAYIMFDYRFWLLPCLQSETPETLRLKDEGKMIEYAAPPMVDNNVLCDITGINYYTFVDQYEKHICVIDLDEFYNI